MEPDTAQSRLFVDVPAGMTTVSLHDYDCNCIQSAPTERHKAEHKGENSGLYLLVSVPEGTQNQGNNTLHHT